MANITDSNMGEVKQQNHINSNKQILIDGLSGAFSAFISAAIFFPFDNFITRCQNYESKNKEKWEETDDMSRICIIRIN